MGVRNVGGGALPDWQAADVGLGAWTYDPLQAVSNNAPPVGTLRAQAMKWAGGTITNVIALLKTAGATLTAGENFAGVYSVPGAEPFTGTPSLVGQTPDQTTLWEAAAASLTMPLTAPVNVPAGMIYVAFLANGTTAPTWAADGAAVQPIGNVIRSGSLVGPFTTLPATLSALTASAAIWAAVS